MRQDTPWNKSYKGTEDLAKELRKRRPRELNRTGAQRLHQEHWDRFFELRSGPYRVRALHPDDVALGKCRQAAEAAQEERELRESLKEVWD